MPQPIGSRRRFRQFLQWNILDAFAFHAHRKRRRNRHKTARVVDGHLVELPAPRPVRVPDDRVPHGLAKLLSELKCEFGGDHPVVDDIERAARGINQGKRVLHGILCLLVWINYRKMNPLNLTIIFMQRHKFLRPPAQFRPPFLQFRPQFLVVALCRMRKIPNTIPMKNQRLRRLKIHPVLIRNGSIMIASQNLGRSVAARAPRLRQLNKSHRPFIAARIRIASVQRIAIQNHAIETAAHARQLVHSSGSTAGPGPQMQIRQHKQFHRN